MGGGGDIVSSPVMLHQNSYDIFCFVLLRASHVMYYIPSDSLYVRECVPGDYIYILYIVFIL